MTPKRRKYTVTRQPLPPADGWFDEFMPRPVDEEAEERKRHEDYLRSIEDAPF